jgi:ethanolamine utilization microcompartment shell protein EutS
VDGVDDLGAVDALEVDRGDAEMGVSELALDDDQGDVLVGHLDRVGVAQLVRCESATHAGEDCASVQLLAGGGLLPVPSAGRAVDHA